MGQDLARRESERYDWRSIPASTTSTDQIQANLLGLISSTDEEEAEMYYWELENVIVVQGQLFEAAPPAASVLTAGLLAGLAPGACMWTLELLFQLVAGESHTEAVERGNPDLGDACRVRAREGLWLFYSELSGPGKSLAKDILERIEPDQGRLAMFTQGIEQKVNGLGQLRAVWADGRLSNDEVPIPEIPQVTGASATTPSSDRCSGTRKASPGSDG